MVVLLVDPDAEARTLRTKWLKQAGLSVHDAADAEAAVAVAQSLKALDVLVTEGWLDEQFSGFDLRDAVRQRRRSGTSAKSVSEASRSHSRTTLSRTSPVSRATASSPASVPPRGASSAVATSTRHETAPARSTIRPPTPRARFRRAATKRP